MSLQNFWNAGGTGINTVKQIIWLILGGGGILILCCGLPASKGRVGNAWTHAHGVLFVVLGILVILLAIFYIVKIQISSNKKQ